MIRHSFTTVAALLLLGALAACESQAPAPVVMSGQSVGGDDAQQAADGRTGAAAETDGKGTAVSESAVRSAALSAPETSTEKAPAPDERKTGAYTVVRGDTVYGIARRNDLDIRELIRRNALEPPYRLSIGQSLDFPPPRRHTVEKGETLYGISRQHRVSMSELARANDLQPPYRLAIGQKLELPAGSDGLDAAPATKAPAKAKPVPARAVKPRPTQKSPDRKIRVAREKSDGSGAAPTPQQHPRGGSAKPAVANKPTPSKSDRKLAAAPAPANTAAKPVQKVSAVVPPRPPVSKPAKPASRAIPKPPARTGSGFAWPVRGKVVSRYGPKPGGLFNDGVNIAAERGTPIKAAESGVVAYVGNELRGFGNLVLLRHADGWITAYAHTEVVLVKVGQTVQRGDVVASVGSSGAVDTPQLHFEIRKGRAAVNPSRHLKKTAS